MKCTPLRRLGVLLGVGISIAFAAPASAAGPEMIVQFNPGVSAQAGHAAVEAVGGRVTRDLHLINAVGAVVSEEGAERLVADRMVAQVTRAAKVRSTATTLVDTSRLAVSYNASVFAQKLWNDKGLTGQGVGVAVIDTGIAGDLPDFRASASDQTSRVVASVVTNPNATTADDTYGHG